MVSEYANEIQVGFEILTAAYMKKISWWRKRRIGDVRKAYKVLVRKPYGMFLKEEWNLYRQN
jgi:hypothetical protein